MEMESRLRWINGVVIILGLLTVINTAIAQGVEPPPSADEQEEVEALRAEVEHIRTELEELRERHGGLKPVYERGFTLRSEDDAFRLDIGGWVQPRYEFTRRSDAEDLSSFYMRRVRLDVRGHAITDRLTFRIMPELARTANLRDAWIDYAFSPQLQVRFGQFTAPFQWHRYVSPRRQHFAERGVPSEAFGFPTGRDIGLSLHGRNDEGTLAYAAGIFDGAGRNIQFSDSRGHMVSGRLTWAVRGEVPREESDLVNSEELDWSVGGGLQAANKNEARAWDLGFSPVGNDRADWVAGTIDTRLAYQGFSVAADGYIRRVDPDAPEIGSYTGWAYMLSAGYFIVPRKYEIVGRWSQLRLDRNLGATEETEWGLGFNIYHRGSHDWKTRINVLRHEFDARHDTRFIVEHHLQF
jgi:hypothetical protein